MYKITSWYKSLVDAEKTCLKEQTIKKIHYKFKDGREMVEEYNLDTEVLLRRAWNVRGKTNFKGDGNWEVELGDPIPTRNPNVEIDSIIEAKNEPIVTRRNTRINLEWRIRNLPYPIETYSISVDNDKKCIIIRTSNKKYYKELRAIELERLNIPLVQNNITLHHQYNTLILSYKKPAELLEMERAWYKELQNVQPMTDVPNQCKTQ